MNRMIVTASVATATSRVSGPARQHPLAASAIKTDDRCRRRAPRPDRSGLAARLGLCRSSRAHIIGVSVSETTAEIRIVTLKVIANSRNSRPEMSPMNSSGISTAISDTVSDMIVKPICSAPLSAAASGVSPCFDVAGDVFDHDDRVVDDEAGRNRQRHQRQVVEAVAEQVHHAEGADQRKRHGDARNDRRRERCAGTRRSPSRPARRSAAARIGRRRPRRESSWCDR